MRHNRKRLHILIWSALITFLFTQPASAVQIADATDFQISYYYPILIAFSIAVPVWRWFIPTQLANLQVAFEIDDDLYEVHKITGNISDARELLGNVKYGIGLYMMGMT